MYFFRYTSLPDALGNEPVRVWLKSLPAGIRLEIGSDIAQVQWRWPVGKPLVDGFGHGLFEVRTSWHGNIYRVLFCLTDTTIDLELARQRMKGTDSP